MRIDSFLMFTAIGTLFVGIAVLPLFYLLLRKNSFRVRKDDVIAELFYKIAKSIRSCNAFNELMTCSEWLRNVEYQLPPWAMKVLRKEWEEKEKELTDAMEIISGERTGRIQ